jgi:hypothetical protein
MRQSLLRQLPPAFKINNLSLGDSVENLAYYTPQVRYEIDWPALEAIKVSKSMPVGFQSGLITLGDLLTKLTASTGERVRFTTHDNVIRISTSNTPPSTHGVQCFPRAGSRNYFDDLARATGPVWPPQTGIKSLYECTMGERRLTFGAHRGYLGLCLSPRDPADIYYKPRPPVTRPMPGVNFSHTAFLYQHHPWFDIRLLILPFWWLVAATAFFPLLCVVLFLRRLRRKQQHLCPNCGYDLRATPALCPECGHIPSAPMGRNDVAGGLTLQGQPKHHQSPDGAT